MVLLYITSILTLLASLPIGSTQVVVGAGVTLSWQADGVGLSFLVTVTVISASVLVWSYYYLDSEAEFKTLTATVMVFAGSMIGLVLSLSLPSLLVCWDLLGFTSFFLVAYYRTRPSLAATLLTGLTNRVGDCALLLLLGLSWGFSGTGVPTVVLLAASAITKSAQLPFSAWLPAAISAPTPVSALVHSSTLVTAGVYLLYRFNGLPSVVLLSVGLATTALASAAACTEADTNKVVALSTLSHLGLIFVAIGLGEKSVAFAHLCLHATSKALLFLGVGTAIHAAYGSQELRASAALLSSGPGLLLVINIAVLSLSGLYFLAGSASKDAILWSMFSSGTSLCGLTVLLGSVCLSVGYGVRLLLALARCNHQQVPVFVQVSIPITTKLSMGSLAALAVVQGAAFGGQFLLSSPPFDGAEALLLCVLLGGGVACGYLVSSVQTTWLGPITGLAALAVRPVSSLSLASGLQCTEAPSLLTGHAIKAGVGAGQLQSNSSAWVLATTAFALLVLV